MTDFSHLGLQPYGAHPNERQMRWYRRGKTAFLHITVNTFTDREWGDGTESPEQFHPTELDCRQWARVLKDAGFTAAILTAKHHDGFCLWHTAYTEHSVAFSPCKVDIVKEFTDACREYGIEAGIYLSPWDRHHPEWGTEAYNDYYANQLTELMTHYGPICECWWDGAGSSEAHYDWERWTNIIRKYQPECVIFGCLDAAPYVDVRWVGTEGGVAGDPCYATIDPDSIVREDTAELNRGKWGASAFIPAETNTSIRPGWFYHASQDSEVRTPENLVKYWFESAGRNTSILLNLPPDRRGRIHERDAQSVIEWNRLMEKIFENDIAPSASIEASGDALPCCEVQNLLTADDDRIYASTIQNPEITLHFASPVTFDCFRIDEVIELGHRVRGFSLDVFTENQWKTLLSRECIGFCRAERIAPVTASAVRIRITQADVPPVLRRFSLYNTNGIALPQQDANASACYDGLQFSVEGNSIVIDLVGIYPYNHVEFASEHSCEIFAFNGTRFERIWVGEHSPAIFPTVRDSYKLKIVFADAPLPDCSGIRILFDAD